MKLSEFLKTLVRLGIKDKRYPALFRSDVLRRWLMDHAWVSDPSTPCAKCAYNQEHLGGWFTEADCQRNVEAGGQCYRETLKTLFVPFVEAAPRDEVFEFQPKQDGIVHRSGPKHDGIGEITLSGMIDHELGGILTKLWAQDNRNQDKT